jgi:hypothetical protein
MWAAYIPKVEYTIYRTDPIQRQWGPRASKPLMLPMMKILIDLYFEAHASPPAEHTGIVVGHIGWTFSVLTPAHQLSRESQLQCLTLEHLILIFL